MDQAPDPVLGLLRTAFGTFFDLCRSLTPEDWKQDTDCPGWTVKDQVSHICGIETMLLGRPRPASSDEWPPHVKNAFAANNEADVDLRRGWPPDKILAEFRELTAARMQILEQAEDWDSEAMTPLGPGVLRDLVSIRVVDVYYHEQDIRRATNKPGNLDGDVAAFVAGRMQRSLAPTVGKRVAPPDGTTVYFDIVNPPASPVALRMEGGRATPVDPPPPDPDVTLQMTTEGLLCLAGGRWDIERAVAAGWVEVEGDVELGRRILEKMAVTP